MHIPDNFLDLKTVAVTTALAGAAVGMALRQTRKELPPARVPLLGLSAAFVFAAQMLNFPILAGTSGHLAGGVLVASLLGPAAAVVVMTAVLIVQCLLFSDGGLTTLGANILNLGVIGAVGGWLAARVVARSVPGPAGRVAGVAFGGWFSMVLAATACALQLAWSGTVRLELVLPAMVAVHAVIGLAEGLISALVLTAVVRLRPEWTTTGPVAAGPGARSSWSWALLLCFALAVLLAPWASSLPDGLERVAESLGFDHRAGVSFPAPLPDYTVPGVTGALAVSLAGALGTAVVFALALLLGRVLTRPSGTAHPGPEASH